MCNLVSILKLERGAEIYVFDSGLCVPCNWSYDECYLLDRLHFHVYDKNNCFICTVILSKDKKSATLEESVSLLFA